MSDSYTIPTISINDIDTETDLIIDARSPLEFEEFCFHNSINIPIFSNTEREKVGTIYKQKGKQEAMRVGLAILSRKLPMIYEEVLNLHASLKGRRIIVTCARGGMRSSSIVSTMNMMGIHCYQLVGGIRTYRMQITEKLEALFLKNKHFFVLSGHTGTRKTDVLKRLKMEGFPVIDLEELAGHRGSVFGSIGLKAHSQKTFEMLLAQELENYKHSPFLIIESESKRIGNIVLPDFFIRGKENGTHIELHYPLKKRIEHLLKTYVPENNHTKIVDAFHKIKKRLPIDVAQQVEECFQTKEYRQAFGLLLFHYYDPMYNHAFHKYKIVSDVKIEFNSLHEAVEQVKLYIYKYTDTANLRSG